jgi:hypothetical protein
LISARRPSMRSSRGRRSLCHRGDQGPAVAAGFDANRYRSKKTECSKIFQEGHQLFNHITGCGVEPGNTCDWLKSTFLPLIENTACEAASRKQTHYQIIDELVSPRS